MDAGPHAAWELSTPPLGSPLPTLSDGPVKHWCACHQSWDRNSERPRTPRSSVEAGTSLCPLPKANGPSPTPPGRPAVIQAAATVTDRLPFPSASTGDVGAPGFEVAGTRQGQQQTAHSPFLGEFPTADVPSAGVLLVASY